MPRMARIVIPGVPHHVTRARQPPRGRLLRRRGQAAVLDVGGRCGGSLCAATPCSNRTPAGRRRVRRAPGENPRPHLPPPQTRPASQPKTEEEMILCPRNSSGVTAAPAARGPTPAFSRGSKSCSLAASRPAARADQGRDHEKIGIVSPDFPCFQETLKLPRLRTRTGRAGTPRKGCGKSVLCPQISVSSLQ